MRTIVLALLVSGCSLLLDEKKPVEIPDSCVELEMAPLKLREGFGAAESGWTSQPKLVEIRDPGVEFADEPSLLVTNEHPISLDFLEQGESIVIAGLRFQLDRDRPTNDQPLVIEGERIALLELDGPCVSVPIELTYLPELVAGPTLDSSTLASEYSYIELGPTDAAHGTPLINTRSTSAILMSGDINLGGQDSAGSQPTLAGPGGQPGGGVQSDGRLEGGGKWVQDLQGGGGGHATSGDDGGEPMSGGPEVGDITLQRASLGESRAGHGGGGATAEGGGAGGGGLFLEARGPLVLAGRTQIDVRGGAGGSGAGSPPGGPGSAGSVFLAATDVQGQAVLDIDVSPSVNGTGSVNSSGGRARLDFPGSPQNINVTAVSSTLWRGAMFDRPQTLVVRGTPQLTVQLNNGGGTDVGGAPVLGRVSTTHTALDFAVSSSIVDSPLSYGFTLVPGVNRLCVITHRSMSGDNLDPDKDLAENCIEVGYLEGP